MDIFEFRANDELIKSFHAPMMAYLAFMRSQLKVKKSITMNVYEEYLDPVCNALLAVHNAHISDGYDSCDGDDQAYFRSGLNYYQLMEDIAIDIGGGSINVVQKQNQGSRFISYLLDDVRREKRAGFDEVIRLSSNDASNDSPVAQ